MAHEPAYTSERVSEEHYQHDLNDYLVYCMHVATYDFARPRADGGVVLDFGCGTGYGVRHLAPHVRRIEGVDISSAAIAEATRSPVPDNAGFRTIPPIEQKPLPWPDDTFDTVLSFQVIEHLPDIGVYLREIRRVLRPGGAFLCATPDRTVRLFHGQRPWNAFHLDEFSADQLVELVNGVFEHVDLYGMTATPPTLLEPELRRYRALRTATLPFTFPGAPERWRQFGLRTLKRLKALRRPTTAGASAPPPDHGFGPDQIVVRADLRGTPNVITVAR